MTTVIEITGDAINAAAGKTCCRCQQSLDLGHFAKNKTEKDGLQRWCRNCRKIHAQKTKKHRQNYRLNRDYGISLDTYNEILLAQGGNCACCQRSKPGGHGIFHVDHCHQTQKIRGLLCSSCNTGIGLLGDSLSSLLRAVHYLEVSVE